MSSMFSNKTSASIGSILAEAESLVAAIDTAGERMNHSGTVLSPANYRSTMPLSKPKRPLSAYNIFFQLERERIVQGTSENVLYTTREIAALQIAREKPKSKRVHRKSHGKVNFADLANIVAAKWKKVDSATRQMFEERAQQERKHYREAMTKWNRSKDGAKVPGLPDSNSQCIEDKEQSEYGEPQMAAVEEHEQPYSLQAPSGKALSMYDAKASSDGPPRMQALYHLLAKRSEWMRNQLMIERLSHERDAMALRGHSFDLNVNPYYSYEFLPPPPPLDRQHVDAKVSRYGEVDLSRPPRQVSVEFSDSESGVF